MATMDSIAPPLTIASKNEKLRGRKYLVDFLLEKIKNEYQNVSDFFVRNFLTKYHTAGHG